MLEIVKLLGIFLALVSAVLFIVVLVGFLKEGPTRRVKISTFAMLLCLTPCYIILVGPWGLVILIPLLLILLQFIPAAIQHRLPCCLMLNPGICPKPCRKKIEEWAGELTASGFVHHSDRWYLWKPHRRSIERSFVRIMKHPYCRVGPSCTPFPSAARW
jgi:hypothetical protein